MSKIKWFNVGLRGLMEVGILIAFAYWGFKTGENTTMKILLSILVPATGFGIWGLVDFRKAGSLAETFRLIQELAISGLAALAWYEAGAEFWGVALGVISIVHHILVYATGNTLLKPQTHTLDSLKS